MTGGKQKAAEKAGAAPATFKFGLETEFLLCKKDSFLPLTHLDLSSEELSSILAGISTSDVPIDGFNIKPLHTTASPYLIEGYYLTDEDMKPILLLPKGIEIRTPLSNSIEGSTEFLKKLYSRLCDAMENAGYACSIISHHPYSAPFNAAQNYKRYDYWQWALTAMTTYGPDINISVPPELSKKIDLKDLNAKVNYYLPAAAALSFASPISEGKLWSIKGKVGKSIRTYRRSLWAPMFYVHEKPSLRFEFKAFEMTPEIADYHAYFLIALAILLDSKLRGRASDHTRIYDAGELAVNGLSDPEMRKRADRVLDSASTLASTLGMDERCLREFWRRLDESTCPADDIIKQFEDGQDIPTILKELSSLQSWKKAADAQIKGAR